MTCFKPWYHRNREAVTTGLETVMRTIMQNTDLTCAICAGLSAADQVRKIWDIPYEEIVCETIKQYTSFLCTSTKF